MNVEKKSMYVHNFMSLRIFVPTEANFPLLEIRIPGSASDLNFFSLSKLVPPHCRKWQKYKLKEVPPLPMSTCWMLINDWNDLKRFALPVILLWASVVCVKSLVAEQDLRIKGDFDVFSQLNFHLQCHGSAYSGVDPGFLKRGEGVDTVMWP